MRHFLSWTLAIASGAAFAAAACSGGGGGTTGGDSGAGDAGGGDSSAIDAGLDPDAGIACGTSDPSFANEVAPILKGGCSGGETCHGGLATGPFGGRVGLVNVPASRDSCTTMNLVTPGDLSQSYLIHKLTGVGMCPLTTQMAPGNTLPQGQMQTVADWVCKGAKDN